VGVTVWCPASADAESVEPTLSRQIKAEGIKPGATPNSIPRANLTKLFNYWGSVYLGGFLIKMKKMSSNNLGNDL
jgi:hypothetical protein